MSSSRPVAIRNVSVDARDRIGVTCSAAANRTCAEEPRHTRRSLRVSARTSMDYRPRVLCVRSHQSRRSGASRRRRRRTRHRSAVIRAGVVRIRSRGGTLATTEPTQASREAKPAGGGSSPLSQARSRPAAERCAATRRTWRPGLSAMAQAWTTTPPRCSCFAVSSARSASLTSSSAVCGGRQCATPMLTPMLSVARV